MPWYGEALCWLGGWLIAAALVYWRDGADAVGGVALVGGVIALGRVFIALIRAGATSRSKRARTNRLP